MAQSQFNQGASVAKEATIKVLERSNVNMKMTNGKIKELEQSNDNKWQLGSAHEAKQRWLKDIRTGLTRIADLQKLGGITLTKEDENVIRVAQQNLASSGEPEVEIEINQPNTQEAALQKISKNGKLADTVKTYNYENLTAYENSPFKSYDETIHFDELRKSIREKGIIEPIIVWEKDDGTNIIISGHHRAKAAYEENMPIIGLAATGLTDEEARSFHIETNCGRAMLDASPSEKMNALTAIFYDEGYINANFGENVDVASEVAKKYDMSKRSVYYYINLNKLIPELLDKVDNGSIGVKAGANLSKLPEDLQKMVNRLIEESPNWRNAWAEQIVEIYRHNKFSENNLRDIMGITTKDEWNRADGFAWDPEGEVEEDNESNNNSPSVDGSGGYIPSSGNWSEGGSSSDSTGENNRRYEGYDGNYGRVDKEKHDPNKKYGADWSYPNITLKGENLAALWEEKDTFSGLKKKEIGKEILKVLELWYSTLPQLMAKKGIEGFNVNDPETYLTALTKIINSLDKKKEI